MSSILRGSSAIFIALSLAAVSARAQNMPEVDSAIDVQLFDYAIGPKTFVTVNDGTVLSKKALSIDMLVTFLTDPYTIYNVTEDDDIIDERTAVVSSLVAGQINAAYGLTSRLQLGAGLPVILNMSGDAIDPATARPMGGGYNSAGLGDLRLELKAKLYEKDQLAITAAPVVTVPTSFGSNDSNFLGDDLPSLRGYGALQWRNPSGVVSAGANLGFIVRKPREVYSTEISQQLTYGAGVAYRPLDSLALIAETFGRTGFGDFFGANSSPLEVLGAARLRVSSSISVMAGGGGGLVQAIGSPGLRFFASVGWAPDFGDTDGDGVGNMNDGCPLVAEDKDGFQDSDGCPDTDNDGDLLEDGEDKCPMDAEDKDGFQDDDGCPDLDNDGDGFADIQDRCPVDKEDGQAPFPKDGCPLGKSDQDNDGIFDDVDQCRDQEEDFDEFADEDGCPELDNDGDGISDAEDTCPLCSEDKDGYEDEDGCPELDNDGDGIADSADKCPMEREVINGVDDEDGCPDSGGRSIASLDGDRVLYQGSITFRGDARLATASSKVVRQVGAFMRSQADVAKWRVVVAIKTTGTETEDKIKAQAKAQLIKNELIAAGLEADKIDAIGVGAERELVAFSVLARVEADPDTAGTCPAQYQAKP